MVIVRISEINGTGDRYYGMKNIEFLNGGDTVFGMVS